MLTRIVAYSLQNKLLIMALVVAIIAGGIYALININLNAVPDITNNQVQIVTSSPTLASAEVEQYVTSPVELALSNLPDVEEVRSISRYGLSVITVVFDENMDILTARQYVREQLDKVKQDIPTSIGTPELMPITTGLGEVYQYVLTVDDKHAGNYDLMELRTIQDWIIKRQLAGIEGVIEISSFGGFVKQFEIGLYPEKMKIHDLDFSDVERALNDNNEGVGGSYVEYNNKAFYLRSDGRLNSLEQIANVRVKSTDNGPVLIKDIATVRLGSPNRFGAMTMDGKGEVVGGITLMLKNSSSSQTISNIHERIAQVGNSLPAGVSIYPYLDRSVLVGKTINTVKTNLIEGSLIVIFVLVLFLGNIRAGLIVASVIPLSMLFTFIMMRFFGVSANLMSLGAIDFGIVVDGAVIVVEGVLHTIMLSHVGKRLTGQHLNEIITKSTGHIYKSAAFGVLIILVVFIPILSLKGIEGKMFKPMAMTISFAVLGALILSLTYVPVMISMVLRGKYSEKPGLSDKIVNKIQNIYRPFLNRTLKIPAIIVGISVILLIGGGLVFSNMGGEFIPTLEEGDLAMQLTVPPGSSLSSSIRKTTEAEQILKSNFPEVKHVVSKIGTAEVPTDPMAIEDADVMILLKDKDEWKSADNREDLIAKMKSKLSDMDSATFEFTQPIQLRFNELMTGAKSDIVIKITGENTDSLKNIANRIRDNIVNLQGAGDVKVEQTDGLPQLNIKLLRDRLNFYKVDVADVNMLIKTAYAGTNAGVIYDEERKFDITMRLDQKNIKNVDLGRLQVKNADNQLISLGQLVDVQYHEAPMQISREDAKRMIKIGINVRNRDVVSLVEEIQSVVNNKVPLPAGYMISYGGQFENMNKAMERLIIVVPVALLLIFLLLYSAFKSLKKASIIFFAVPLSALGGILALYLRGIPFSISAAIGFIALFGVAVLNGLVLISEFNRLDETGKYSLREMILQGASTRLRPVLMTAMVASLGFLPMALSQSNGAEVQRPLATVVIGGLVSSTLLTLIVIPSLYYLMNRKRTGKINMKSALVLLLFGFALPGLSQSDSTTVYSYQQLLDRASNYSAETQANLLEQRRQIIERDNKIKIQPADVMLQYGQINDATQDKYIEIDQNLSDFWKHQKTRSYAGAMATVAESKLQIDSVLNRLQMNELFFAYRTSEEIMALYARVDSVMDNLSGSINARFRSGDLTKTDFTIYNNVLLQFDNNRQEWISNRIRYRQYINRLTGLVYTDSISTDFETRLPVSGQESSADWYLTYYENQSKALEAKQAMIRAQYGPDLSFGYFHQSFGGQFLYNGLKLGVTITIFNQGKKQEYRIVDTEKQFVEANRSIEEQKWNNRLEANKLEIESIHEYLQEHQYDPEDLEEELKNVQILLLSGEMSMIELNTYLESIINAKITNLIKENRQYLLINENNLIQNQ